MSRKGRLREKGEPVSSGTIPNLVPLFQAPPRLWGSDQGVYNTSVLVYRAINILSGYMRAVGVKFVNPKDATKEVALSDIDPIEYLFRRPNSILNGSSFWELLEGYKLYHGGYIVVMLGASGLPVERGEIPVSMLPFPIAGWRRVTMGTNDPFRTVGWEKVNSTIRVENHQCVVSQCLDVSGRFQFVSPVGTIRDTAASQTEVENYQAALLQNNGRPGVIISNETTMQDEIRRKFQAEWMQAYGGSYNAGKPAVLSGGKWQVNTVESMTISDIVSDTYFRDSVRKVGMAFGMSDFVLAGITDGTNKASSKEIVVQFLTGTVELMFRSNESTWNDQFFERYRLPYRINFDQWSLSAFRDVMATRMELVKAYLEAGMSVDDAYQLAGIPYKPNEHSKKAYIAGTLREITDATTPEPTTPGTPAAPPASAKEPEDDPAPASEPKPKKSKGKGVSALDLMRSMASKRRREQAAAIWERCATPFEQPIADGTTKAVKRMKGYFLKRLNWYMQHGKPIDEESRAAKDVSVVVECKTDSPFIPTATMLDSFLMPQGEAVASIQLTWRSVFGEVEKETVAQMSEELGELTGWFSMAPEAHRDIALTRLGDAIKVEDTIRRQLVSTLTDELTRTPNASAVQVAAALRAEANHVFNNAFARANTIARTEIGAVMGDYRLAIMQAEGVEKKRWSSAHDGHTRPTHSAADAEGAIPMHQAFEANNLQRPHDPEGPAHEVCNCRCVLLAG